MEIRMRKIERFEITVGGEVALKYQFYADPIIATLTIPGIPERRNPVVAEAVSRAVRDYGETIRKLSGQ